MVPSVARSAAAMAGALVAVNRVDPATTLRDP
jgi:hypothetical protein